jgi:hypothetical protein
VKIFFASFTDLELQEVDAWVGNVEEGLVLLDALRQRFEDHAVVMRARVKRHSNMEEQFVGIARDAGQFMERVAALATQGASQ